MTFALFLEWAGRIGWLIILAHILRWGIQHWRATHQAHAAQRHLSESETKGN